MREEFLAAVFRDLKENEGPCFSPGFKGKYTNNARGLRRLASRGEWLYCVSSVPTNVPKIRSRLQDVKRAFVLPLDDIGTKSRAPIVAPSYILETSEGNYQYGYLLAPFDVSSDRGANYYDGCLLGMAEAGYNDAGCRSASRMIKMPGAIHAKTGFEARLIEWHPERIWPLKKLMREFGVTAQRVSRRRAAEGKVDDLRAVTDPLYDWLVDRGINGYNETFVYITCPWEHEHTSGGGSPSSTAYSPLDYGLEGRQFRCLHGHCVNRNIADLIQWAATEGFDASLLVDPIDELHTRLMHIIRRANGLHIR